MAMNRLLFLMVLSIVSIHTTQCSQDEDSAAWRKKVFTYIYEKKFWWDGESVSGPGSSIQTTSVLRHLLPAIVKAIDARSLLDAGCGDFNWMREVSLEVEQYIGADIVLDLIIDNQWKYGSERRTFLCLDVTESTLPHVDVIFCRDCLAHLSYADIKAAIRNFKKSKSIYFLTTTYPRMVENKVDIRTGDFRPVNLQGAPFNFPEPLMFCDELSAEDKMKRWKKRLCLWRLDDISID